MALRRWKPFVSAFPHIDASIEASDADCLHSRDEIRSARARIIEMLCDASDDDDGEKAEGFCALLDHAMAESLITLRAVPVEKIAMASGDLVGAVGALMTDHDSARVRGLARDVVRGWRPGAKAALDTARAAMDVLDGLSATSAPHPQDDKAPAARSDTKAKKIPEEQARPRKTAIVSNCPLPKKRDPVVSTSSAKPSSANRGAPVAVPSQPKKTPPVMVTSAAEEKKMEATKRKLHERYQEAEDAKRRRTIQVINKPPRGTTRQGQRNAHPGVRPNCARGGEVLHEVLLASDEGLVRRSSACKRFEDLRM